MTSSPAKRPKSYYQQILDARYSTPLAALDVPVENLSPERLLAVYLTEGEGAEADLYWYFRPWRSASPRTSGVYVRRQRNGYVGFAYYDADARVWLYTHDTLGQAERFAAEYLAETSPLRRYLSYHSNHQQVEWSCAPTAGLEDLNFATLRADSPAPNNEAAVRLALLRWTMDPQRKRRQFGG
jgi:hypothetical protein